MSVTNWLDKSQSMLEDPSLRSLYPTKIMLSKRCMKYQCNSKGYIKYQWIVKLFEKNY